MIVTGGRASGGATTRVYTDDGSVVWSANHGAHVFAVAFDGDGNVITGGNRISNLTTRKYAPEGTLLWSADHGATVTGVATDASGNVITVGARISSITTRKYAPDGTLLWSADHGSDLFCVATDPNGNIYTGGYSDAAGAEIRVLSPSGGLLWSVNNASYYAVYGIAVRGSVVVTTGTYTSGGDTTRTYSLSGTPGWTYQHGAETLAVCISASGDVLLTGNGSSGYSRIARKLNASGVQQWDLGLGGGTGYGIAVDDSGNGYLASNRISSITTRKYAPNGNLLWSLDHGDTLYAVAWVNPAQKTTLPGVPLSVRPGEPWAALSATLPGLPLSAGLGAVSGSHPPDPPDFAAVPLARIYRAWVAGTPMVEVPLRTFQCVRRAGTSTWITMHVPTYSAERYATLVGRIGSEVVLDAGVRDSDGVETLGLFLRATLTEVEFTREPTAASVKLTARVINPAFTAQSRVLRGIRSRNADQGRWTVTCEVDPLLRPNDTVTGGGFEAFVAGIIHYTMGPNEATMVVTEVKDG